MVPEPLLLPRTSTLNGHRSQHPNERVAQCLASGMFAWEACLIFFLGGVRQTADGAVCNGRCGSGGPLLPA